MKICKKLSSIIMALIMLASFSLPAFAAEIEWPEAQSAIDEHKTNTSVQPEPGPHPVLADVQTKTAVNYSVPGGKIVFDTESGYITDYTGSPTEVDLPEKIANTKVKGIGSYAFDGCDTLKTLKMTNGAYDIEECAFRDCTSLNSITLSADVHFIGDCAFENTAYIDNCANGIVYVGYVAYTYKGTMPNNFALNLKAGTTGVADYAFYEQEDIISVSMTDSVVAIGWNAFDCCYGIETVKLSNSLNFLGVYAFSCCYELAEISIPASLETIQQGAFNECSNLSNVVLPMGLKKIESYAFYECESLNSIFLPEGLTDIEEQSFYGCSGLSSITIPASIQNMYDAFIGCYSITDVVFEDGLTVVPASALSGLTGLENVIIPNTVTLIDDYAFYECSSLEEINLPNCLTEIGYMAFYGCTSLRKITLPASLTNMGEAFSGCDSLEEIVFADGWTVIPESAFDGATGLVSITLPDSVTEIGNYAFYGCTALKTVNFSKSLKTIGEHAFVNCVCLESISLPDGLVDIGYQAFYGCLSITEATIPSTVKTMDEAFCGCENFTKVVFLNGIEEIPYGALYESKSLIDITIPDSVKRINEYAFGSCSSLETLELPDSLIEIKEHAFSECVSLETLILPESLVDIGYQAFSDCISITEITIPSAVKTMDEAFHGCDYLTKVVFSNGIEEIPYGALYESKSLIDITIPDSVTVINAYAFGECHSIQTIVLSNALEEIREGGFYGCTILQGITLPESIKSIGYNAFYGCESLQYVNILSSDAEMDWDAFNECPNVTIMCPTYSKLARQAIDQGIPFTSNNDERPYEENTAINFRESQYISTFSTIANSGGKTFVCDYKMNAGKIHAYWGFELKIKIPMGYELIEDTLIIDGTLCTNYEYDEWDDGWGENMLYIPIDKQEGRVMFSVKQVESNSAGTYALMTYYNSNGQYCEDIIGVIYEYSPSITLNTSSVINTSIIAFSGYSAPEDAIKIYLDGTKMATINANKVGAFSGSITIPSPTDKTYILKAVSSDDTSVYAEAKISYASNNPVLDSFDINYNGHRYDLTNGINHSITFSNNIQYNFNMTFENPDNVGDVYVVSTRNNVSKYIKASRVGNSNKFVANGWFDENDHGYVPGTLTVEYNRPRQGFESVGAVSNQYTQIVNNNTSHFNCISPSVTTNDDTTEYTFDMTTAEAFSDLGVDMYKMYVKNVSKQGDVDWYSYYSGVNDVYTYFFDKDGEKYWLNIDYSDPYQWAMIIDDVQSNKFVQIAFEAIEEGLDKNHPIAAANFSTFTSFLSVFDTIVKVHDIDEDYDELVSNIRKSGMSGAQMEEAMKRAKALKNDREMYLLLTTLISVATVSTGGIGGLPFALLMGALNVSSEFFFNIRAAGILAGEFYAKINWCIDPSGYVYEGVTQNRLQDVKTTIYCIPFDDSDPDFWDEPDTSKAVLWNASEYSQENPLYTDASGNYAWDVPEGWWQVRYELEGYETAYSEWMPVPPPQLNVNTGLVSKAVPVVESFTAFDDHAEIVFSKYMQPDTIDTIVLKNAAGEPVDYSVSYSMDETSASGVVYATRYILSYNGFELNPGETITATVGSEQLSYADVGAKAESLSAMCKGEPRIKIAESVNIITGNSIEMTGELVFFDSLDGVTVTATSGSTAIAEILSVSGVSGAGEFSITVDGKEIGYTVITVNVAGTTISASITVHVTEEIKTYTVTFEDGLTGNTISIQTVEHGADVVFPTAPTHEGYTFTGWDSDGTNIMADTTITAQYAINTYTVTFMDGYTNEVISTVPVEHGADVTFPEVPVHNNYLFTGWDHDGKNITADITITAQYVYNMHTIMFFDSVTNEFFSIIKITHGEAVTFPEPPVHEGYHFTGWDNDGMNITQDTIITALYEINTYTVTFVNGHTDEVITTATVEHGADATFPEVPTYDDYHFTGWDHDGKNITADTTITAQYAINTYTVTFKDGLTGDTISTSTVEHGADTVFPTAPTHDGYTFTGWDSDGKNITADITITALYEINTYTVTFVDGHNNEVIGTATVEHGADAIFPEAPIHEGCIFTNWDSDGKNITADITITALYEINTYTVTFKDGLNGNTISTTTVEYGKDVSFPNAPTHEGYTFNKWDNDGKNITADITITALYDINVYTVTLKDGYNNSTIKTVYVEHGKDVTFPNAPVHEGYTFTGWDNDGKNIKSNMTITALYEINTYTVTFVDGLTGETITTVTVEHGKDAQMPNAPEHEGYEFTGWDKNGKNITADTTITAQYELAAVTGDLNGDGKINTADAVIILKIAAGMIAQDENNSLAGDCNHDGKVNTADAVLILKYAAGMITEF